MSSAFRATKEELAELAFAAKTYSDAIADYLNQDIPASVNVRSPEKFRQLSIAACMSPKSAPMVDGHMMWFEYNNVKFMHFHPTEKGVAK